MSAIIGKLEGSEKQFMIAAKNVVSIEEGDAPDVIVLTTVLGEKVHLHEPGVNVSGLLKWFETFLTLEAQR